MAFDGLENKDDTTYLVDGNIVSEMIAREAFKASADKIRLSGQVVDQFIEQSLMQAHNFAVAHLDQQSKIIPQQTHEDTTMTPMAQPQAIGGINPRTPGYQEAQLERQKEMQAANPAKQKLAA